MGRLIEILARGVGRGTGICRLGLGLGQGAAKCLKIFRLKLIGSNKFIVVVAAAAIVGCPGHETRRRPRDSRTTLAAFASASASACCALHNERNIFYRYLPLHKSVFNYDRGECGQCGRGEGED